MTMCCVCRNMLKQRMQGSRKEALVLVRSKSTGGGGNKADGVRIPIKDMECFLEALFQKVKLGKDEAKTMTNMLLDADRRGYSPHGIYALPKYLCAMSKNIIDPKGCPKILKETNCVAWVDGGNALGPVAAKFSMDLAMQKAKKAGGGLVSTKNSNYFGPASHYSRMATKNNLIGLVMSNTPPVMVPFGGQCSLLGANPLAFAAKGCDKDEFTFDMASTKMAKQHVEWKAELCEKLPPRTALGTDLKETVEPRVALSSNKFLPFGDLRGYGFSLAIEILTGIMSGANYGSKFQDRKEGEPLNVGHMFMAIDPSKFYCHFPKAMGEFLGILRNTPPKDPKQPIRIPGDHGLKLSDEAKAKGIPYNKVQMAILKTLSDMYKVDNLNKILK